MTPWDNVFECVIWAWLCNRGMNQIELKGIKNMKRWKAPQIGDNYQNRVMGMLMGYVGCLWQCRQHWNRTWGCKEERCNLYLPIPGFHVPVSPPQIVPASEEIALAKCKHETYLKIWFRNSDSCTGFETTIVGSRGRSTSQGEVLCGCWWYLYSEICVRSQVRGCTQLKILDIHGQW